MKIRILKDCKINGVPQDPGAVVDVTEVRAKALVDNGYAEIVAPPKEKTEEHQKA